MATNPLVSIVTPSLNQGRFIEETILSVKNQTYPRIEHIVIDGGSKDGTLDILKKYSDSLIWISEPDKGQADAINKGWRMSKGEILAYLNSDDTYMPGAVETAVRFFSENQDVGMVYGRCNIIDEHDEVTGEHFFATEFDLVNMLCYRAGVPQQATFFRKKVLDEVGYLDTNLHMAMDFDLWIRIGLKFKIRFVPQLLANFRLYAETKSLSKPGVFWTDHLYILDKLFTGAQLPNKVRRCRRQAYGLTHLRIGLTYYGQGQMKKARGHLIKSLVLYPRLILYAPHGKSNSMVSMLVASFLGERLLRFLVRCRTV